MTKKILLGLIIVLISQQLNFAQEDEGSLVTFTETDGVPSNSITSVIQDHLGFIWVGTENGLLKYDGYKFHRYDLNNNHPMVATVFEDSKFNLWIGVLFGVVKYNREKEKYNYYGLDSASFHLDNGLPMISEIDEDSSGTLWFGVGDLYGSNIEGGLAYLRKGENLIKKFPTGKDSVAITGLYDIEIDDKNNLWASGESGLLKIDITSMSLEKVVFKNSSLSTFNSAIIIDNNGIIWGGKWDTGFGSYNPSNGKVKSYSYNSSISNSISNNNITSIYEDKDGTLWLATVNGINHFNPETEKFKRYFHDPEFKINYTSIGIIRKIIRDKSGSIWLGSEEKFLHKFEPSKKLFLSYKNDPNDKKSISRAWIFALEEDSKGNVWVGGNPDKYNSGLSKYNPLSNSFTRIPNSSTFWPGIMTIYEDRERTIWIGTYNAGLLTFNSENNSFTKVEVSYQGLDNNPEIVDVIEDHLLNLWIGTEGGLFLLDKSVGKAKRIALDTAKKNSGDKDNIQHIIESRKKDLWIGTTHGFYKYSLVTKNSKRFSHDPNNSNSLSSSNVGYIYEDKSGILWLGTWGGGLNRFDENSNTFSNYNMEDGLPSNNIQGILGDEDNNALWLSTFEGISRFDLNTKEFRNFDASHGVQGKQFARTSALKSRNGDFFFGGKNGLNFFRQEDFLANLDPPDLILTDFKIFNKSISAGKDSPLEKPIYDTEKIILEHDENDISIDFIEINYVDPSHNEYAYRLENYENEWRYVGNLHSAIYPNLPPGEYNFHVKAANSKGVWNEKGKTLQLIILPPWWKTIWAYIGYGFILVLGIFSVDRIQRKRLLHKAKERMKIQEAEHRAQTAELQAKAAEAQSQIIQAENDLKTKELEEARQLQLSMLPKELPKVENLDIAVYMQTATEVGGDYYDFSTKEDGSLNICLGDATGHGMKAGTLVSMIKSLFTANSVDKSLSEFFSSSNKALKNSKLDKMMMAFAMLNIKENKIMITNAGIPPVYIYRIINEEIEEVKVNGLPLGAMKNTKYKIHESELSKGDVILMLSDGFPELQNDKDEMYGYERVISSFKKVAIKSSEEIINYLKDEGSKWVNDKDPDDDVTFVVIKVK